MPTFEIPDGPTTVELKRSGDATSPATGSIVFNVTNKSAEPRAGRLGVVVSGSSQDAWFAIDGERERTFAAGETQTATIKVCAPPEVAAGDYPFRLRAVSVDDPDNDHAEGPVATAKVPAAPAPTAAKPKWWLWILIALVVLLLIGGALWFAFGRGGDEQVAEANAAQPAQPTPQPSPPATKVPGPKIPGPNCTLTGVWRGNDGGTYRMSESGSRVAWRGESADGGKSWAHNFRGFRDGSVIKGHWADTAGPMGKGTLTLRVDSQTRISRIANSGSGFGGSLWTRRRPCG